jgi:hypothetical protein
MGNGGHASLTLIVTRYRDLRPPGSAQGINKNPDGSIFK